ncbi:unnamed protein product [Hermetia illucens]|uniref:Reverse transcriptase/retrotransposon-derived protein RNase H-like domain-containing protein n=1 Tax=Hermetia illucens TaxID=343691 RepID=A0A7R8YVJ7_HERIL|nr:unnamed protein product [Hermetia illucens]
MCFRRSLVNADSVRPPPEKVEAAKELCQFLRVIDFYRNCMPNCAKTQASLNRLLVGNIKGKAERWIPEAEAAFQKAEDDLAQATLLANRQVGAPLALLTDASDFSVDSAS